MKVLIITIILGISVCFSQHAQADSTIVHYNKIGFDKVQHAAFSFLWTLSGQYILEDKFEINEQKALSVSVGSIVLLGVSKEINDKRIKKNKFNWADLLADGIGIAVAVFIITR